jgi:hypothetical protein
MPVDERARHKLYLAVEHQLGPDNAETLMTLLPPVGWADVATRGDIDSLEHRIDSLERRMESLERRMETLEAAIRGQTRTFVGWLLASQATLVSVVVAATAIFR